MIFDVTNKINMTANILIFTPFSLYVFLSVSQFRVNNKCALQLPINDHNVKQSVADYLFQ